MKITIAGVGAKHDLEIEPSETVRAVKSRLEPLVGLTSDQMKIIFKGKTPADDASVDALGIMDGAKLMLMKSQQGAKQTGGGAAKKAVVPSAPHWLLVGANVDYLDSDQVKQPCVVKAIHTDDPPTLYCTIELGGGAERQTPADRLFKRDATASSSAGAPESLEAGSGSVTLHVSQGRRQLVLHCEPASSVAELKGLLAPLTGADAATMKLLYKGKEATDKSSVESLGIGGAGGKLMLLFREKHHRQQEGAAAVASCAELLDDLRTRVSKTRHKITKRLLHGAEALTVLGALEEEVGTILLDLKNAAPNESSDAAKVREANVAECEKLTKELADVRRAEAQAELMQQIGR